MRYLQEFTTKDGSISLKSTIYNEDFHSYSGALKETQLKFINPSLLQRFRNQKLQVLDVCFGLGYNSALLFNNLISQSSSIDWFALEIDKSPLNYSINNNLFRNLWDYKVINIFESLRNKNVYSDNLFNCELVWGDARKGISRIPKDTSFDLIFLDGFSPQKCPEIWSLEFLSNLTAKLKTDGYLITYCAAAAVRKALIKLGLDIFNIKPLIDSPKTWSCGTLAMFDGQRENPYIDHLSVMEKEHLETKASIPYRDPDNNSFSKDIIMRRNEEQLLSKLLSTSNWRKKWGMTKPTSNG